MGLHFIVFDLTMSTSSEFICKMCVLFFVGLSRNEFNLSSSIQHKEFSILVHNSHAWILNQKCKTQKACEWEKRENQVVIHMMQNYFQLFDSEMKIGWKSWHLCTCNGHHRHAFFVHCTCIRSSRNVIPQIYANELH